MGRDCESAEQDHRIKQISGRAVLKEGKPGDKTGLKSRSGQRVHVASEPNPNVADDEKENGTRNRSTDQSWHCYFRERYASKKYDQADREILKQNSRIKSENEVAQQKRAKRRDEGKRTPPEISSAEQRHCVDWRKIGWMRDQPQCCASGDRAKKCDKSTVVVAHKRFQ